MSEILIKGMEMPKSCKECPFSDHQAWCLIPGDWRKRYYCPTDEVSDDCPLIEVPDHGDLIDRGELLAELHLYRERLGAGFPANEVTSIMNRIRNQKTVIPADKEET